MYSDEQVPSTTLNISTEFKAFLMMQRAKDEPNLEDTLRRPLGWPARTKIKPEGAP